MAGGSPVVVWGSQGAVGEARPLLSSQFFMQLTEHIFHLRGSWGPVEPLGIPQSLSVSNSSLRGHLFVPLPSERGWCSPGLSWRWLGVGSLEGMVRTCAAVNVCDSLMSGVIYSP